MWVSQKLKNAQHYFVAVIEKWFKTRNKGGQTGAVLIDLSEAFNCIGHSLLITKLNACGVDKLTIYFFILSCLKVRKQRTNVNISYSSWRAIRSGVLTF